MNHHPTLKNKIHQPLCQLRLNMATGSVLFLAFLSLSTHVSSSHLRLGKCCPPGEVFSGEQKVDCVPTPPSSTEFYSVDNGVPGPRNGFPICEEVQDVTTTPLREFNASEFLQIPPCLEILHIEATEQDVPIVAYCRSNKDRPENYEAPSVSLPRLLNVRRCCPKNEVLDVHTKSCLSIEDVSLNESNASDIDEFLELLPKNLDTVDFLNVTRNVIKCPQALFTYEISAKDITFEKGELRVMLSTSSTEEPVEGLTITEENTCLELTTEGRLAARICRDAELCKRNNCIRKCCPEGQSYVQGSGCTKKDGVDSAAVFYEKLSNISVGAWKDTGSGLLTKLKCANGMYSLYSYEVGGFMPEGYVLQLSEGNTMKHYIDEQCMDVFYNRTEWNETLTALVCFPPRDQTTLIKDIVSSILQAISCVFLVLTLLVYICLPSLQNLHGKTLMCHAASLLLAYTCLAVITWLTPESQPEDFSETTFCELMGYIMFFAFLSTFTWLNVMCFDIWRTFGRLRGNFGKARSDLKRFLLYCFYAWGLAIFMTVIIIFFDEVPIMPKQFRPNFGLRRCWFLSDPSTYGELIFFRGPIAIQLISNVVFFILTSEHCSKVKAEIRRVADPSDPRSKRFHADKTKLVMNIKLFIVMGITWVAEIVSSFLNMYTKMEWQKKVFYASDAINCLQGLLIFILFVMKPRVYEALKKRLGFSERKKGSSQGTSTVQDPFKVKKSASNSTLTSSMAVSSTP